jgi:hypothetical protein
MDLLPRKEHNERKMRMDESKKKINIKGQSM